MHHPPHVDFGACLLRARKARKLSQVQLANRCRTVTVRGVSKYERGRSIPGLDCLLQLAHALEMTLTELVGL